MPDEMIARLDAESKRTGASKSEIVRRAVASYLDVAERRDNERPAKNTRRVREAS